jgi:Tol biopolymer transport system component/DNA-binding winged helix-turn-helix (wHTH) protein
MSPEIKSLEFGEFLLDLKEKVLLRNGERLPINPKTFQLLVALIEDPGHLVEKERLMGTLWPDSFVEDANLAFTVSLLRKTLGDDAAKPRFIETIPRRGYRFIAPVHNLGAESEFDPVSSPAVNGSAIGVERKKPTAEMTQNGQSGLSDNGSVSKISTVDLAVRGRLFSRTDRVLLLAFVICVVIVALALTLLKNPTRTLASRLNGLQIERLSDGGNNAGSAISPDGKLIAYSTREAGKPVIWLRQLLTGRSLQIVPPLDQTIAGISFSRNGEYLDYLHLQEMGFMDASRISILGGTPTRFLSRVHSGFSFSPDETKVAFGRMENGTSSIFVANADGSGEQLLISAPKGFSMNGINWAPDGNSIAFFTQKYPLRGRDSSIHEYDLASGKERALTEFKWNEIEGLKWLPDKSGVVASGTESAGGIAQIWLVALPSGETRQISSGTASLILRGVTADFSKLVAIQSSLAAKIWIGDLADPSTIKDVSQGQYNVALSNSGTIVFPAMDTLTTDIWISNSDGTERKQLTADKAIEGRPNISRDGKFVAYVVDDQGGNHHVWRMGVDGSKPVQLTDGEGEDFPTFTPDSRFVIYNSVTDGSLMKVPVEGGEKTLVFKDRALRAAVAPDGKRFAYVGMKERVRMLFVRSLDSGSLLKEFAIPGLQIYAPKIVWNANGGAILFAVTDENNVANIFQQRLDGTKPEKLTDFTSERIFDFSLSPSGSRIALVRGIQENDTVLLTPILD